MYKWCLPNTRNLIVLMTVFALTATSVTIKMLTFLVVNLAALIFLAAGSKEL